MPGRTAPDPAWSKVLHTGEGAGGSQGSLSRWQALQWGTCARIRRRAPRCLRGSLHSLQEPVPGSASLASTVPGGLLLPSFQPSTFLSLVCAQGTFALKP